MLMQKYTKLSKMTEKHLIFSLSMPYCAAQY